MHDVQISNSGRTFSLQVSSLEVNLTRSEPLTVSHGRNESIFAANTLITGTVTLTFNDPGASEEALSFIQQNVDFEHVLNGELDRYDLILDESIRVRGAVLSTMWLMDESVEVRFSFVNAEPVGSQAMGCNRKKPVEPQLDWKKTGF